jgi:hypothetical protein
MWKVKNVNQQKKFIVSKPIGTAKTVIKRTYKRLYTCQLALATASLLIFVTLIKSLKTFSEKLQNFHDKMLKIVLIQLQ